MKNYMLALGLAAGVFGANSALAQVAVSGDYGTTGFGVHVIVPVQPDVNFRVGVNALNYSYNSSTSNVDYDFKLKLNTFDALLDYFPTSDAFRVSGGLIYNGDKIDATGKPNASGSYRLNGTTYSAASAGTIDGKIDFRKVAPYLGIGWGNAVRQPGWGFTADLGVMFQGSPKTSLTNSNCTAPAATCAQLASDLAAENVVLADKVNKYKYYPVARIGVTYSF